MPNTIIADWLNLPGVKFHEAVIHGDCTETKFILIGITLPDLPALAVGRCHSGAGIGE
ncbi:hypothetical protein M1N42_02535 [Thermodesulfovibrionales bacterium]|nr:hypothetical protein [Thermodesulfovibrionales bacterium]